MDAHAGNKRGFSADVSLESLRAEVAAFAEERDWNQFHTPRNLLLALVGEVGEVSELFQWRGECKPGLEDWSEADRTHLGEELSDVLVYLIRLADRCGVDLAAAVARKLQKNREKYPADRCRGRSDKYTAYADAPPAADDAGAVAAAQGSSAAAAAGKE